MCDTYTPAGEPIPTNKRHAAAQIFSHPDVVAEVPWLTQIPLFCFGYIFFGFLRSDFALHTRYGIEQEYTLLQKDVKWPVGWPIGGFPGPQVYSVLTILLQFSVLSFWCLYKNHIFSGTILLQCWSWQIFWKRHCWCSLQGLFVCRN